MLAAMLLSRVPKSRVLFSATASSTLYNGQLVDKSYLVRRTFPSLAPDFTSYIQDELANQFTRSREAHHHLGRSYCSSTQSRLGGLGVEGVSLPISDHLVSDHDPNAREAAIIQENLKFHENSSDLESALDRCMFSMTEDLVVLVLRRLRSDWKPALSFFNWAAGQQGYAHGSRAYNEMLDILGRMKQISLMRQVFDKMPKEGGVCIINERTFAILLNRYAASHKVEEAIETFYKRKDYGFKLDLVAFQTLLMSLCRYKHVEEAESLFLQKQDEFPPVIKSRNIILNGWCVLGSSREAKRFWNDIISSKCKPDLYTYSIFINSLTKAGKLGSAVKLFTAMWEKGCHPDAAICNCIIDALCFKKKIPEALEIFGEMNERGCLPDVVTYNSLIKHLCKIRRMEKVHELLDDMEQRGCLPNARTYSYILKTTKKSEEVTELLRRMERTGSKIDGDTYNLILKLYVGWKYQKGIQSVWADMERNGFGPDQRSYTIMIHGLHSQGKLDEALQYYSKMRSKGMIPEPRTRLLVKAIHLKREETTNTTHHSSVQQRRGD